MAATPTVTETKTLQLRSLPNLAPLVKPIANPTIELTALEEQICTLLDDCTRQLRDSRPELEPVECRIAGGWVRDKLLGSESNDIDIALSTMTGIPFAELFLPFLAEKGIEVHSVAKIARNPEQSKHLETARVTVLGLEIDFVNLRSEAYAEDSRIPSEMGFGTPLQDALRRDITINALFYNVHSRAVEDFTEKGLADLGTGTVRTPLAPRETFMDDPLRVLRCVRFASRFGFELVPPLRDSAKQADIQEALKTKISRERIGDELDKMVKGRNPLLSIQLIESLSLYNSIFWLPTPQMSTLSAAPLASSYSTAATTILQYLLHENDVLPRPHRLLTETVLRDEEARRRLYLGAMLTPYGGLTCKEGKKQKEVSVVEAVVREGLKVGNRARYLDSMAPLFRAAKLLSKPSPDKFESSPRASMGLLLRDKSVHNALTGSHWSSSLLFALAQDLVQIWNAETDEMNVPEATRIIEMYNAFTSQVEELGLPHGIEEPPRLNASNFPDTKGNEICETLSIKPGAHVASITNLVIEWQLKNAEGTKETCKDWLMAEMKAGRLPKADVANTQNQRKGTARNTGSGKRADEEKEDGSQTTKKPKIKSPKDLLPPPGQD